MPTTAPPPARGGSVSARTDDGPAFGQAFREAIQREPVEPATAPTSPASPVSANTTPARNSSATTPTADPAQPNPSVELKAPALDATPPAVKSDKPVALPLVPGSKPTQFPGIPIKSDTKKAATDSGQEEGPATESNPDGSVLRAALPYAPSDVVVVLPPPVPLLLKIPDIPTEPEPSAALASVSTPAEKAMPVDPAVQLRIKIDGGTKPAVKASQPDQPQSAVSSDSVGQIAEEPETKHKAELPAKVVAVRQPEAGSSDRQPSGDSSDNKQPSAIVETARGSSNAEPPRTTDVVPAQPERTASTHRPEAQPAAPIPREMVPPEPQAKGPLRSMSFELGQDGGGEVKLRLSERSGEVHVSLHSNDAVLNHQLREGVQDLASVLGNAGYDAEAWTGQGRDQSRQRQQNEAQPQRLANSKTAGQFDSLLNQIPQEVI